MAHDTPLAEALKIEHTLSNRPPNAETPPSQPPTNGSPLTPDLNTQLYAMAKNRRRRKPPVNPPLPRRIRPYPSGCRSPLKPLAGKDS